MKIIGLTGGTGTGKTTALNVLKKLGGVCIDADEVYHDLLLNCEEMINEIKSAFPALDAEGPLDRKKLGEIVFSDSGELKKLNAITHKYVCRRIMEIIEKNSQAPFAAIDAVELVESGAGEMCDTIVAIIAPVSMRIDRIMSREGISMGYATMRIAAQKSDKYYEENCDIVIRNDYNDRESFEKKCFEIFEKILEE